MKENSFNLISLLRGGVCKKPPFWEVWFGMWDFCQSHWGDYSITDNRLKMAEDLDMAAVLLGGIDTKTSFAQSNKSVDGMDHYSGGGLQKIEQLQAQPLPNFEEICEKLYSERQKIKDQGFACWVILPWCFHSIATSMGLENFALKLFDDFEFIDTAFEWVEQRNRDAIQTVIKELKPDFVLFDGDCAYKTGLMVQPGIFKKLVFDKSKKTVKLLNNLDIPYTFHTDGKIDNVIPILIDLGFSAVHGCEKAANDLDLLVEDFSKDINLVGNMDVNFLAHANTEEVRRETLTMLKKGSKYGRYIAGCNTSPQDYIPDENYFAMAKTIREYKS